MRGVFNRLVVIDVSHHTVAVEALEPSILEETMGGRGLAARLLLDRNPPGVDPLAPDNRLIFATGPANGSPVWGSCRHGVFTKSPQTQFFSESYSGGTVAESMVRTGFDALVVEGASVDPVWIEIGGDGIHFHSAAALWGKDTYQTEDAVKQWLKDNRHGMGRCGVVCIGPAGENGVVFAVIENDRWRSAGRTGTGAVMGSKGIKAIAFWGSEKKPFGDPDGLKRFAVDLSRKSKDNPGVKAYKHSGTPMLVDIMNEAGGFPTRYWSKGRADHREQINAGALHARCDVRPHACLKCLMACGRLSTVKAGPHRGLQVEGPEYETIYAFGGLCEVQTIEEILYLNDLCDRLGMDTITAGNLAGLTIEAARAGRIHCDIDYGDTAAIARLLEAMASREGVGAVLSQGIRHAAGAWQVEDLAIHVKGLEPAGYDPRVLKGMGLAYGTSARGACHLRATFYKAELSGVIDAEKIEGKARVFAEWEDRLTLFDTLILCRFYRDLYQWPQLGEIVKATTGKAMDVADMRKVAAHVTDLIRRFNLREGLTMGDDRLPARFHREVLPETGKGLGADQMETMLREYYRVRGWNEKGEPPEAPQ
ncbi:MAG: aldehyde ferredoxin oxidoreductase family protein [Desulfobacterales bacterium]|jgi:aldehyde:ferredoxin oxidoreductase